MFINLNNILPEKLIYQLEKVEFVNFKVEWKPLPIILEKSFPPTRQLSFKYITL